MYSLENGVKRFEFDLKDYICRSLEVEVQYVITYEDNMRIQLGTLYLVSYADKNIIYAVVPDGKKTE